MTFGTGSVRTVFFDQLSLRQTCRDIFGELRYVLGGLGNRSPSKVSDTQLPRNIGLVREAPDCFASTVD